MSPYYKNLTSVFLVIAAKSQKDQNYKNKIINTLIHTCIPVHVHCIPLQTIHLNVLL